jgi:hypothetical protein
MYRSINIINQNIIIDIHIYFFILFYNFYFHGIQHLIKILNHYIDRQHQNGCL